MSKKFLILFVSNASFNCFWASPYFPAEREPLICLKGIINLQVYVLEVIYVPGDQG
jgi:hypothetical protein